MDSRDALVSFSLRAVVVPSLLLIAACAGSSSKRSPAASLTPSPNAPEWVHRTSYVDGRSFYGVGLSAGVKNQGLARSRAGNRARSEIAKLVEVYSASLMKDYAASVSTGDLSNAQEEQLVEQAVKTFTSQLLVGVEVTRFYPDDRQGVLYALAELNLDRQAALAAAKSKMGPGLKAWVEQNQGRVLDGLDKDLNKQPPTPPPAPPQEEFAADLPTSPAPVESAPPAVESAPPAAGGLNQRSCDTSRYLCAVGQSQDRGGADVAARAELARVFEANIQSVAQSYASAARTITNKTGERWIETSKFAEQSMVTTNKAVRMSQILGRWTEGGVYNSLAGVDRRQAAADLRARIQSQDEVVATEVASAEGATDAVQRLKYARSAIEAFVGREALNSDLRVVRADGRGIPPPITMADLLSLLEEANRQLSLGIALAGQGAERVQACLEEALTARGYEIQSEVDEQANEVDIQGDFDVLIQGKLRSQSLGKVGNSQVVQVQLTVRLVNGKSGRILKTISGSRKGTRPSVDAAMSTAAFQLCRQKVPQMIRDIDRYFVR